MKDPTCIAWHTEQCPYGDENGVCQHHTNMDQDVEHCKRHEREWKGRSANELELKRMVNKWIMQSKDLAELATIW